MTAREHAPLRIWLVRHGESMGNVDLDVHRTHADHAIDLSPRGRDQARRAGVALARHLGELGIGSPGEERPHIRLWTSPYERTRQTADGLQEALGHWVSDRREDIRLCEQQFGLFDGIPDEQLRDRYPVEYEHYDKQQRFEGRFWARMPLGESRFDVANRIHAFLGTLARDRDKHGIANAIVVCHGVTLRAFVMQRMHLSPEWFEAEPNPKNCAIRLLDGRHDRGYVFPGFGKDEGRRPVPPAPDRDRGPRRIALVSCVKSKHATAHPARELYTSALFTGMRTYAERHADEWYVLSAKHGLLDPDEIIEPYELTLNRMPASEREAWATRVREQLERTLPRGAEVLVLAGERYRAGVLPFLRERGHRVHVPMEGLPFGRQLQFLSQANADARNTGAPARESDPASRRTHEDTEVSFHPPNGRTLSRLTSRSAVLAAIAEYDQLGGEAFLDKYGYGPARRFFLEYDGRQYDSKAIVGVAFGVQHPEEGHLRSDEFSGGVSTVQKKLEELGFTVVVLPEPQGG